MKFNDLCSLLLEDGWDEEFHFWKVCPYRNNTFMIFSKETMTCRQLMAQNQVGMDMETMISSDSMIADPDAGPYWTRMSKWDFAAENSPGLKNYRKVDFKNIINSGGVAVIGDLLEKNHTRYDQKAWVDMDGEMCVYACKDVKKIHQALRNKLIPVIEYDYKILDTDMDSWTNVQFTSYKPAKEGEGPEFLDLDDPNIPGSDD